MITVTIWRKTLVCFDECIDECVRDGKCHGACAEGLALFDRIMRHVDASGDCWVWTGAKCLKGYASIKVRGRVCRAHREMYKLTKGDIGDMMVCHSCDNPSCVRPEHLFLGTSSDNMRDCVAKGRSVFQRRPELLPRGEGHHSAKLTAATVAELRALHRSGQSARSLARRYGVSSRAVDKVVHGRTWRTLASGYLEREA
jgi:hypothetical protein